MVHSASPKRYQYNILRLLFLLLFCFLVACVKKPSYVPPVDPFAVSDPDFQMLKPKIDMVIAQFADSTHLYVLNEVEEAEQKKNIQELSRLAKRGHVPSISLLGSLLVAHHDGFAPEGELPAAFPPDLLKQLEAKGKTTEEFRIKLIQSRRSGIDLLTTAARTGYRPAANELVRLGISIPGKDLYTASERQALRKYKKNVRDYQKSRSRAKSIVKGVADGMKAFGEGMQKSNSLKANCYSTCYPNMVGTSADCFTQCY